MVNAREELLEHTAQRAYAITNIIVYHRAKLYQVYSGLDFNDNYMDQLDFEYDPYSVGDRIYGVIWFSDNSWSTHVTEKGAQTWRQVVAPTLTSVLEEAKVYRDRCRRRI